MARRFIRKSGRKHPATLGRTAVIAFLSGLATEERVSASTQNQALAALLFLYKEVLGTPLDFMDGIVRAKRPKRLPVVLSPAEVERLLNEMHGAFRLMASLLYGSGLRRAVPTAKSNPTPSASPPLLSCTAAARPLRPLPPMPERYPHMFGRCPPEAPALTPSPVSAHPPDQLPLPPHNSAPPPQQRR